MLINFGYCYKLIGEVEGYEYIFNIASSYLTRKSFNEINNYERDKEAPFIEYTPSDLTRTIETRLPDNQEYEAKFILLEGRGWQSIVNRHSTKKYLNWIDDINQKYTYEYDSNYVLQTKNVRIIEASTRRILDTCPIIWK